VCAATAHGENRNVTYHLVGQDDWTQFIELRRVVNAIQQSTGDSIGSVVRRLDEIITDEDQYELDEARPSEKTVRTARKLLRSMANVGYQSFPKTYISIYYGEIAISWKTDRNLVRLTFHPDGAIELYRQADYRESARGESIQVTVDDKQQVAAYIRWLSEDTRAADSERHIVHR
jgi:hypothetical protein